jgi:hypothetical protein
MLATLAVGVVGGMFGALLVSAIPATGSPGDPLTLSAVNQAGPMTVLKSNGGFRILAKNPARPPLMVYTPDSMAPFQISSAAKVDNLNADLLDGLDSSAFVEAVDLTGPRGASASGNGSVAVGDYTSVRTLTIEAPTAGWALVNSTATASTTTAGRTVYCSISTGTFDGYHAQAWESAGPNGSTGQLAGTRLYRVYSDTTLNLICVTSDHGPANVGDATMAALYVPDR